MSLPMDEFMRATQDSAASQLKAHYLKSKTVAEVLELSFGPGTHEAEINALVRVVLGQVYLTFKQGDHSRREYVKREARALEMAKKLNSAQLLLGVVLMCALGNPDYFSGNVLDEIAREVLEKDRLGISIYS